MTDLELERSLRTLRRTVLMLQTELRHGRMEADLLDNIDQQMERGIATDQRCTALVSAVDRLRENTLTPRTELLGDTIRACDKLLDAIAQVLDNLR